MTAIPSSIGFNFSRYCSTQLCMRTPPNRQLRTRKVRHTHTEKLNKTEHKVTSGDPERKTVLCRIRKFPHRDCVLCGRKVHGEELMTRYIFFQNQSISKKFHSAAIYIKIYIHNTFILCIYIYIYYITR